MGLNCTPMSKVLDVWIGPDLPCSISSVSIYYVPESDIRVKSYEHMNFLRTSVVLFWASRYIMGVNRTPMSKVMIVWIGRQLPCSISSASIYSVPESDIRVKSYDHLNCSRASFVQFRTSRYIMRLNRTSEWKVMTIWISRELPLFNVECLDVLCDWIWHLI